MVHCGFDKVRADSVSLAIALAIVGDESLIVGNMRLRFFNLSQKFVSCRVPAFLIRDIQIHFQGIRQGNRVPFWVVYPTQPKDWPIGRSSRSASPLPGEFNPAIISKMVVLPQPLGPEHYKALLQEVRGLSHVTIETNQCLTAPCILLGKGKK